MTGFNQKTYLAAEKRRQLMLEAIVANEGSIPKALEAMGMKRNTYERWRERYPEWKNRFDSLRQTALANTGGGNINTLSFADYRLKWFGHRSPWVHLAVIKAMETTRPGNITMVLLPPESGKTALLEDYICYQLDNNANWRATIGSEAISHSQKILGSVMNRMEPEGPFPEWVISRGPFVPQFGTGRSTRQPWSIKHFDVYRKAAHDSRDYNVQALGFGAKIRGTRTDQLVADDIQSIKSLNQTEAMLDEFRHDWLSRPGENGRTLILATRVDENDFYERLEEEIGPDILRVIRYPAIVTRTDPDTGKPREQPLIEHTQYENSNGEIKTLGWTLEGLERIREKVGERGWAASYMMAPQAGTKLTFDEELIEKSYNPLRSVLHPCSRNAVLYFSVDPAIGSTTAIAACEATPEKLKVLDILGIPGLMRNEDIFEELEKIIAHYHRQGGEPTELVIEAKNFQAGLARDDRLLAICDKYGVEAQEHLTDVNKYDENIGLSSMARSFRLGEIELPWAGDDETRDRIGALRDELLMWRPLKRGNRLRQDRVMALWFAWIFWRERRGEPKIDSSTLIQRSGMPFSPTRAGLLVPR